MKKVELAYMIDHTNLKPDCTKDDILKLCEEAEKYRFKTVCVYPRFVSIAKEALENSDTGICSVVGFPSGEAYPYEKFKEGERAIKDGADELDIVMNYREMKSDPDYVKDELRNIVLPLSLRRDIIVKVILENCYLSKTQIRMACDFVVDAGADFVKTSTGFGKYGARVKHVKLMRKRVGPDFGVKAAGGIRTLEQALKMVKAGADRLGCSSSVKIVEELK